MLVMSKCITAAFDNDTGKSYLPVVEYEIDTNSKLASLTTVPVAYDDNGNAVRYFRDSEGQLKSQRISKPPYVFEFDRALPGQKIDYTCEQCGEKCKSLNALGTHVHSRHNAPTASEDTEDDTPVVRDGRGRKKGRTFNCKFEGCTQVLPNLYALKVHNKAHRQAEEKQAEAATAA